MTRPPLGRALAVATAVALLSSGCVIGDTGEESAGGGSQLRPDLSGKAKVSGKKKRKKDKPRPGSKRPRATPTSGDGGEQGSGGAGGSGGSAGATSGSSGSSGSGGGGSSGSGGGGQSSQPAVLTASVSDARGDVRGSLTGAPAYVDLTGAEVTLGGAGYRIDLAFAGAVPARRQGDDVLVVVCFFDLDGDGETDHKVGAATGPGGWGGSRSGPDGARYGDESGVRASPAGTTLTLTFGRDVLDGDDDFGWAAGIEEGTPTEIAAGTTVYDLAPDAGAAPFPN